MSLILTSLVDYVGTVTLNNQSKRNALSKEMLDEMLVALEQMQHDRARAIVLRACRGSSVWSAGHDVNELPLPGRDPLGFDDPLVTILRAIHDLPIPVIAMVGGSVWGGACDLAFTCDILIGCDAASFCMTPAKLGVPYNASGLLRFMNVLGVNMAKEMFFTAQPISAERAYRAGILNHLVPAEVLEPFTYDLAEKITRNSPLSISAMKESFRLLANASPLTPNMFERIQGLRRKVYDSKDYREGIAAFLEKRAPVFKGE